MFTYSYNIVNQYLVGVVSAVCGFVIYIIIKIKIEEWLDELRMSRLSLKRYRHSSDENKKESPFVLDSKVVEITDDESEGSKTEQIGMSETLSCDTEKENAGNSQRDVFTISTDSGESDEETRSPIFKDPSNAKSKSSMFNWDQRKRSTSMSEDNQNKKQNSVQDDSDSADSSDNTSNIGEKPVPKGRISDYFNKMALPKQEKKREKIVLEVEEESVQHELTISGVKVKFPMKPYSCQTAVMFKLIRACTKGENCLLESPTGSGKTLALLCGVLAWQDHCAAESTKTLAAQMCEGFPKHDINDGSPTKKCCEAEKENFASCSRQMQKGFDDVSKEEDCEGMQKVQRVPKVYYGSRTHRQIEQVIRELKKTAYKQKKMTILSSREHTCLQNSKRNKTELCNELLDPIKHLGCPYYNDNNKRAITSFPALKRYGLDSAWDIEDLVTLGQEESICPYFAAKNLMVDADIIFCPYNYLVDPDIRESMQINLQNQIIILDEAHNIEDSCREVGSVEMREDDLTSFATECKSLAEQRAADYWTYHTLTSYIHKLVNFIKNVGIEEDSFGDISSSPYWTGEEMIELLNMHNLGQETYADVIEAAKSALADFVKSKEDGRMFSKDYMEPVISTTAKRVIQHLMLSLQVIFSENTANDYRICVMEYTVTDTKTAADNTWYSSRKQQQRMRSLKLLCMNPGVIFSSVAKSARSIILASGTLTPISSFQSELATEFVHILNAPHVIPKEQVYATCVPRGPNGVSLKATYQSVNTWNFQDELGGILYDVCQTVPHGVLCFFSSYHVRDTQITRWKRSSLWSKIEEVKQVFLEPRRGGDLASIMREYREIIEDTSKGPVGKINGALLLAVFRGKVAEGIDFSDEEARCVMTVGIPYAVRKDPAIDMKMKYNDANVQKGLLRGSEWYTIQAFRALNQALGRCVRHMNDWGALLLVDDRFLLPENTKYLPKWFKAMWIIQRQYDLKAELNKFVATQKARDNAVK